MTERADLGPELSWRQATAEDLEYVVTSWLRSYKKTRDFGMLDYRVFRRIYEPVIRSALSRAIVGIASLPDLPTAVIGWIAFEPGVLHYVYTKGRFRHMGVARWMVENIKSHKLVYSHRAPIAAEKLLGPHWQFDPMARFEEWNEQSRECDAEGEGTGAA